MAYKESELTCEEILLARDIRDMVPRRERLQVVQSVALVIEGYREKANEAATRCEVSEDTQLQIWQSLHFPRYRFFDVALPNEGWAQFAESED
jgi:hypothetical protein